MKHTSFLLIFFSALQSIGQVTISQQRVIDSAYHIAQNNKNTIEVRLKAYEFCCWKTVYQDFNQGLKISTEYVSLAKTVNQNNTISAAFHFLAHSQMMLGLSDEANKTLQEGLEVSIKNKDFRGIAELYGDLGNLNNNLGKKNEALEYHAKSLEYSKKHNITIEEARAKINIGEIYESQGNYKLSIETFQEALDFITNKNNFGGFKSSIYENLGDVNVTIKEFETAEKNYVKAVEFAKLFHNNNRLINSLNKLGKLNLELNNLNVALQYFNEALDIAIKSNASILEAKVRSNLANINLKQNNLKEALVNINLCIIQFKKLEIKDDLDKAYIIAAKINEELNQKQLSKNYYKEAYDIAKTTNNISTLKIASEGLAIAYEENGDIKNAITYYKEFNLYSNQIRDEDGIKEIIRLELQDVYKGKKLADSINKINEIKILQLDFDKKEAQSKLNSYISFIGIGLLLFLLLFIGYFYNQKRKIAIVLEDKNKVIHEALNDKEVLLKEVHHRVKNNMQIVSSLLHLKSKNTEDKTAKDALVDSKKRIDAMQLAHQKMYQKGNYQQIDILEYFNDIVDLLLTPIKCSEDSFMVTGNELWIDVEQSQALGFILHELMANSIKYAWNNIQAKKVEINISKVKNEIQFTYSDNGKGLPNKFNIETATSFGMKLIQSLVTRQLLGKIELSNTNGFTIIIKFDAR
jgi:two-component sensor histidine kinase